MKRSKNINRFCLLLWSVVLLLVIAGNFHVAYAQAPGTVAVPKPDPNGSNTGGIGDVGAVKAGEPTVEEIATAVGKNKVAINIVRTLITGFLVMFMQAGFALVETGFTQAKNVAHTMAMNFLVYPLGMLGFFVLGFGFMFGGLGAPATMGGYSGLSHET
jgi:Amt family ammonium transporter